MGDAPLARSLSAMARQVVPGQPLEEAIRAVFEVVALARASGPAVAGTALAEALRALAGEGEATIIGAAVRLDAPWAALANAASAARATDSWPAQSAIPVVAAAVAVAETLGAQGAELLSAVAVGLEVIARVHQGVGQFMAARGWDETAATGGLGAAVAAGRLLALDERALTAAIGIASTRAAGLRSALGTDVAAFQVGKAAADGIEAARMAGRGFTSPATSIEGRRGLGHLLADDPCYPAITALLGDVWRIRRPATWAVVAPGGDALYEACQHLPAAHGLSELIAAAQRPL